MGKWECYDIDWGVGIYFFVVVDVFFLFLGFFVGLHFLGFELFCCVICGFCSEY